MIAFPITKVLSAASAVYGAYAIARPAHLGRALESKPETKYDSTARIFGIRDVVVSTVALLSKDRSVITAAAGTRVAFDIGDCLALRGEARTADAKRKITGITLGWAALNAAAYAADRKLSGSHAR